MIRMFAVGGFALILAASAQAMTPAPIAQSDDIITQVAFGCGPGRTRVRKRLRGENHHPPDPTSGPQVCAMASRCLHRVVLAAPATGPTMWNRSAPRA